MPEAAMASSPASGGTAASSGVVAAPIAGLLEGSKPYNELRCSAEFREHMDIF
jgi:hypothetical protein